MKADLKTWIKATENLNDRRKTSGALHLATEPSKDYISYIEKCGVGKSVLDVGCGSQTLRLCLPEGTIYKGLDAFPIANTNTYDMAIEEVNWKDGSIDTICAFAVLDNCRDFYKACANMIRLANKNIIILTGIGIDVDKFHTFRLEFEHFDKAFKDSGFELTVKENLYTKVWLLNYQKLV